jgi:hypothetical protein
VVAAGVDDEPLDLSDVAVGGMDVTAAAHKPVPLSQRVAGPPPVPW